jgi:hypothetical protein
MRHNYLEVVKFAGPGISTGKVSSLTIYVVDYSLLIP